MPGLRRRTKLLCMHMFSIESWKFVRQIEQEWVSSNYRSYKLSETFQVVKRYGMRYLEKVWDILLCSLWKKTEHAMSNVDLNWCTIKWIPLLILNGLLGTSETWILDHVYSWLYGYSEEAVPGSGSLISDIKNTGFLGVKSFPQKMFIEQIPAPLSYCFKWEVFGGCEEKRMQ